MYLLFAICVWLLLGGFVYRAHKQSGSTVEYRHCGDRSIASGFGSVSNEIPDTVPSDWVEAYRAEYGG